jgi:hypothetical protein
MIMHKEQLGVGEGAAGECDSAEAGQSIVLITLIFAALVAFLGLATDTGLAFVRSAQHSQAVDAAALAGVVDLTVTIDGSCSGIDCSDLRAQQFLAVNGWPADSFDLFNSDEGLTPLGYPEYTITVTWPVETFFLRILGIRSFDITHTASAAYYAQADIIVPTDADGGQIRKAPQFVTGNLGCSTTGDPVMPRYESPGTVNFEQAFFDHRYRYRIRVPVTYAPGTVVVELFDTDTANLRTDSGPVTITHSRSYSPPETSEQNCPSASAGAMCVFETGESLEGAFQNPLWFHRVDEVFDTNCQPLNSQLGNTVTRFHLFYVDADGTVQDLAIYTDDNSYMAATDLKWVSPCAGCDVNAEMGNFTVDDLNPIPAVDGFRVIYLDVTTTGGSSRNVWDVWARPPFEGGLALPSDVNVRNLWLVDQPFNYFTQGIEVYAMGRMPLQHYITGEFTLRVTPLPIDLGFGTVYASVYDFDVPDPWVEGETVVNFQIDTVLSAPGEGDFIITASDPDPAQHEATCKNSLNCNARWLLPQYRYDIVSDAYAGGTLLATYEPQADGMTWSFSLTAGRPFLTR